MDHELRFLPWRGKDTMISFFLRFPTKQKEPLLRTDVPASMSPSLKERNVMFYLVVAYLVVLWLFYFSSTLMNSLFRFLHISAIQPEWVRNRARAAGATTGTTTEEETKNGTSWSDDNSPYSFYRPPPIHAELFGEQQPNNNASSASPKTWEERAIQIHDFLLKGGAVTCLVYILTQAFSIHNDVQWLKEFISNFPKEREERTDKAEKKLRFFEAQLAWMSYLRVMILFVGIPPLIVLLYTPPLPDGKNALPSNSLYIVPDISWYLSPIGGIFFGKAVSPDASISFSFCDINILGSLLLLFSI